MSERETSKQQAQVTGSIFRYLWQRKLWWMLPLVVLLLLLAAIYILGHMSSADPETYPTTLRSSISYFRVC